MAGTRTVVPAATSGIGGSALPEPVGSTSRTTCLADTTDATYIRYVGQTQQRILIRCALPATVPANARLTRARVTVRASTSSGPQSVEISGDVAATVAVTGSVVARNTGWRQLQGDARRPNRAVELVLERSNVWGAMDVHQLRVELEYAETPTVVVTGPATPVTATSRPAITWTYAGDLPEGRAEVYLHTTGADPVDIANFEVEGDVGTWTPPPLANGSYRVSVRSFSAGDFFLNSSSDRLFTVAVQVPVAPTVNVIRTPSGAVQVAVADQGTTANTRGSLYDIERLGPDGTWVPVAHRVPLSGVGGSATFLDRWPPLGGVVQWRARTVRVTSGDSYLGVWSAVQTLSMVGVESRLTGAPGVDVDVEAPLFGLPRSRQESGAVHRPLDGSAAIVVDGPPTGLDGTLQILAPDLAALAALDVAFRRRRPLMLRTLDGRSWWISLRSWSETPDAGTTQSKVDVSFVEVAQPASLPVTG